MIQLLNYKLGNNNGKISTKNPFAMFGPTPMCGSHFWIACTEWVNQPISKVIINISWGNIPADFAIYYEAYSFLPPCTNSSFKVNIYFSYQNNRHLLNNEPLNLFEEKYGAIASTSTFSLPMDSKFLRGSQPKIRDANLDLWEDEAIIAIELVAPTEGFGSSLYPAAINNTVLENATALAKPANGDPSTLVIKEMPNLPYSPIIENIVVWKS